MELEDVLGNFSSSVTHFLRKQEYDELTVIEASHVKANLNYCVARLLDGKLSEAQAFITRAEAIM